MEVGGAGVSPPEGYRRRVRARAGQRRTLALAQRLHRRLVPQHRLARLHHQREARVDVLRRVLLLLRGRRGARSATVGCTHRGAGRRVDGTLRRGAAGAAGKGRGGRGGRGGAGASALVTFSAGAMLLERRHTARSSRLFSLFHHRTEKPGCSSPFYLPTYPLPSKLSVGGLWKRRRAERCTCCARRM